MDVPAYHRPMVEEYIRRYSSANMTARIRIVRGIVPDTALVYEGRARIHRLQGSVQMGFGDEPQYMVTGTVSIPQRDEWTDEPNLPIVDDTIEVLEHHDTRTVGMSFRVMHVDAAGQFNSFVSMSVVGAERSPTVTRQIL